MNYIEIEKALEGLKKSFNRTRVTKDIPVDAYDLKVAIEVLKNVIYGQHDR